MDNGTIMNRSQFRKFGIKVAELVATMRRTQATRREGFSRQALLAGRRDRGAGAGTGAETQRGRGRADPVRPQRRASGRGRGQPARHRRSVVPVDVADTASVRAAAQRGWARSTAWSSSPGVYWPMQGAGLGRRSGRGDVRRELHRLRPRDRRGAARHGRARAGPCRHHRLACRAFAACPAPSAMAPARPGMMALAESM